MLQADTSYRADEDAVASELIAHAGEATELLKALAHESRLIILCLLAKGERSVGELEAALTLRQPTVSQQLARLRADRLVNTRKEGKTVYYSLASPEAGDILRSLYSIYCPDD